MVYWTALHRQPPFIIRGAVDGVSDGEEVDASFPVGVSSVEDMLFKCAVMLKKNLSLCAQTAGTFGRSTASFSDRSA